MRIGPAPLIPAYPIQPDRQEVYPRALGQTYQGTPRLSLPEVKAQVPDIPTTPKESRPRVEATVAKPLEGLQAQSPAAEATPKESWKAKASSPGSLLDVRG